MGYILIRQSRIYISGRTTRTTVGGEVPDPSLHAAKFEVDPLVVTQEWMSIIDAGTETRARAKAVIRIRARTRIRRRIGARHCKMS